MIKINLADRKQSGLSGASKGTSGSFSLGSLGNFNFDDVKELPIRKLIVPLLVCLISSYSLDAYKEKQLEALDEDLAKLQARNAKLQEDVSKFKVYEAMKTTLDEDESMIKRKLETIRKLISDRTFSYQLLISVSKAMPKDVWISELTATNGEVTLKGQALEITQISDFMKSLGENPSLLSVELNDTNQSSSAAGDIASFELKAKRR